MVALVVVVVEPVGGGDGTLVLVLALLLVVVVVSAATVSVVDGVGVAGAGITDALPEQEVIRTMPMLRIARFTSVAVQARGGPSVDRGLSARRTWRFRPGISHSRVALG